MKRVIFYTLSLLIAEAIFAGGTLQNQWFVQQTNTRAQGDYVSATSGGGQYITTNKYYAFFIEVPPSSPRLVVQIFDPNIFELTSGTIGERQNGGAWDTQTNYVLLNPSGAILATLTGNNSSTNNQQWVTLADINNPQNGHWELRVSVITGDDVNIYGVRAHDSDPSADGREYNVYAESYLGLGHRGSPIPNPKSHLFYPYVIRGCGFRSMDFDNDNNSLSQIQFASVDGSYNVTIPYTLMSGSASAAGTGNNGWAFNFITYPNFSGLYGLWTQNVAIGDENQVTCLVTDDGHPADAPTSQPEPGSFRLYLPTDAGSKPTKPQVTQNLTHVSGPNPPAQGLTTVYTLTFTIQNQTPYPITFSTPNRTFRSFVPGVTSNANVTFQGNLVVTQGSIVSQPSIGGSGIVEWNPGSVSAFTNASISYRVAVTPTACPNQIALTGSGVNATQFTFLDETANATQARATLTFGGLCQLQTPSCIVPSAGSVTVQGRVIGSNGRYVANAAVYLTDASGNTQFTLTNAFGYFRFLNVPAGEVYFFEVASKRQTFPTASVYIAEDIYITFTPNGFVIGKIYY
ncbi:MAG: carboxypeptidase-like regulatory domain-containing protein [Acidobacteriota bacterium]|nr:carboxypeptidase-like regulatory domain-containing protein [Pyrinomonadaceae bacterium]MDW8305368.1 carboxypeptidase-like regulatory domain-containing protein [Acidobacteriota bacterium]